MNPVLRFLCCLVLLPATPAVLRAAERVALVIGNNKYLNLASGQQLSSPVADATDVAGMLRTMGYTIVTGAAVTDASREAMADAIQRFSEAARNADAAVFYFSGHGVQLGEDNFLLPSDSPRLTGISVLKTRAVLLRDSVMVALEEAGAKNKVIILDCCRDNPFAAQLDAAMAQVGKSVRTKSVGEITGYGPGFYLAFATSPGTTASDGNGQRNSPFTAAMLKAMPGSAAKDVDFFFRDVKALLGAEQVSWTNHSLHASFALSTAAAIMPAPPRLTPTPSAEGAAGATRDRPFVNSLGMEFIPLPGRPGLLLCRTETRVRDFRAFARATGYVQQGGVWVIKVKGDEKAGYTTTWELDESATWENPGYVQSEDHPVAGVSWNEAKKFLTWLSNKEGRIYRLPTDEEWNAAVGVGKYPWGTAWPPPEGSGNYFGKEGRESLTKADWSVAYDYSDGYSRTSPVASYAENRHGFFDLGGNVWEYCEDTYSPSMNLAALVEENSNLKQEVSSDGSRFHVMRGGSWSGFSSSRLLTSYRNLSHPAGRDDANGFRCMLVVSGK